MSSTDRSGYIFGLAGLATGCLLGAYLANKLSDSSSGNAEGKQREMNASESSFLLHHGSRAFLNETDVVMTALSRNSINHALDDTVDYTGYSAMANFPNVAKNK